MGGFVWLVGAGPGDPELLTRRAARVLAEADLVLYDALVDPATLDLAPAAARRIFVGKRAGRPQVRQEFINTVMIRAARRGRRAAGLERGGAPADRRQRPAGGHRLARDVRGRHARAGESLYREPGRLHRQGE